MKIDLLPRIDTALRDYVRHRLPRYGLSRVHPLLEHTIGEFVLRPGKRIRPILFGLSYLGHAAPARLPAHALRASLAFELLHDFLLVHDDIIDNSPTRRGRPTMHMVFQKSLRGTAKIGQDLALVAADIMHALAVDSLLDIRAPACRKEQALRLFLRATITTGAGEYKDVLNGHTSLTRVSRADIRQNYLLKTAVYTFSAPLACGCVLTGGTPASVRLLQRLGMLLGEAFQMQDDIIGLFGRSRAIGKSILSDIAEAKKTLPLWYAFTRATKAERRFLETRLGKTDIGFSDVRAIRRILEKTGAVEHTASLVRARIAGARRLLRESSLSAGVRQALERMIDAWFARFPS